MIQKLTVAEIQNCKLPPNKVIVKPDFKQDFIGDTGLLNDSRFNPEMHAPTTGKIINQSSLLDRKEMDWDTIIETNVGDNIIYAYEAAVNCLDEQYRGRLICDENNELYFIFNYENILAIAKPDTLIPVNGYILVSATNEVVNSSLNLMAKQSTRYGIIEYIGNPVIEYRRFGMPTKLYTEPKEGLQVGQTIAFSQYSDLPLEYETHRQTRQILFRMQRCDIDAVIC